MYTYTYIHLVVFHKYCMCVQYEHHVQSVRYVPYLQCVQYVQYATHSMYRMYCTVCTGEYGRYIRYSTQVWAYVQLYSCTQYLALGK